MMLMLVLMVLVLMVLMVLMVLLVLMVLMVLMVLVLMVLMVLVLVQVAQVAQVLLLTEKKGEEEVENGEGQRGVTVVSALRRCWCVYGWVGLTGRSGRCDGRAWQCSRTQRTESQRTESQRTASQRLVRSPRWAVLHRLRLVSVRRRECFG
jgi:hypothetical protein